MNRYSTKIVLLFIFLCIPFQNIFAVTTYQALLVKTIQTSSFSPPSPDPAGITYLPSGHLLFSDCEVDEMPIFAGANLFKVTPLGLLMGTGNTTILNTNPSFEPTGVAYDASTGNLFFTDDDRKRVYKLTPGADGQFGTADDGVTYFSTTPYGLTDPEGIAVLGDHLFIASGMYHTVIETTKTGIYVNRFDTGIYNLNDIEGITVHPITGTLFVLSRNPKMIGEFSITGTLIRYIDISSATPKAPADVVFAPSSITTDNPNILNLYIVDRGIDNNSDPLENDGRLYEMSLSAFPSPTIGTAVVTPTPTFTVIPGDANGDGHVTGADYVRWASFYGQTVTNGSSSGDFNQNGIVNGADYAIWLSHYGR